jgi:hypothetical protein
MLTLKDRIDALVEFQFGENSPVGGIKAEREQYHQLLQNFTDAILAQAHFDAEVSANRIANFRIGQMVHTSSLKG